MPDIEVDLAGYPDSPLTGGAVYIEDTPELRAELERHAIPKCAAWRAANPEPVPKHTPSEYCDCPNPQPGRPWHCHAKAKPAPYCCSAYCVRCAGLRALDGAAPLIPNEWLRK